METINVIVLEDNPIDQIRIKFMLSECISEQYNFKLVGVFSQGEELLKSLEQHKVDLVISDIFIEDKPVGIELLKKISAISIPFILMTQSKDSKLFLEAQQKNSIPYLVKPFHTFTLLSTMLKALEERRRNTQSEFLNLKFLYLTHKTGHQEQVWFTEIVYIEAIDSHCYIYTIAKKYTLKKSLKKLLTEDLNEQFIRVHHKFAVNKHHIHKSVNGTVILTNNLTLPVGRAFSKDLNTSLKRLKRPPAE